MNDYYTDVEASFIEVYAIVKGKMAKGLQPSTAKEKAMFNFIREWADTFGFDSI